jgi:hypothetical protein
MNDDLISRKALKKALEVTQYNDIDDLTRTERLIDEASTVSFMISPDYVTELQNLNKELIRQLEEADRPHGEWIPVSERLPKIDAENGWKASDTVLVCLVDGMIHMGFYCEDKKWRFCESGEAKESFWKDVIAWMPLPEPYKEAEE